MSLANMRTNSVHAVTATCANCGRSADVNVDALPDAMLSPRPAGRFVAASAAESRVGLGCILIAVFRLLNCNFGSLKRRLRQGWRHQRRCENERSKIL
jgi:hypothetical protein